MEMDGNKISNNVIYDINFMKRRGIKAEYIVCNANTKHFIFGLDLIEMAERSGEMKYMGLGILVDSYMVDGAVKVK